MLYYFNCFYWSRTFVTRFFNKSWTLKALCTHFITVDVSRVARRLFDEIRLRAKCQQLMDHKWFDYAVLVLIALNCITLAMERPLIPPHSVVRHSRSRFINDFLKMLNNKFFYLYCYNWLFFIHRFRGEQSCSIGYAWHTCQKQTHFINIER